MASVISGSPSTRFDRGSGAAERRTYAFCLSVGNYRNPSPENGSSRTGPGFRRSETLPRQDRSATWRSVAGRCRRRGFRWAREAETRCHGTGNQSAARYASARLEAAYQARSHDSRPAARSTSQTLTLQGLITLIAIEGKLDARRGFEPRLTESESVVLPLDDRALLPARGIRSVPVAVNADAPFIHRLRRPANLN